MMKLSTIVCITFLPHQARAFLCRVGIPAVVSSGSSGVSRPSELRASREACIDHDRAQKGHFYGYGDPNHTPSILQRITAQRYKDVAEAKKVVSEGELRTQIKSFDEANGGPLSLYERIVLEEPEMVLAAEFKRASPSKGDIALDKNAGEQGYRYASVGAAALSVLTEPNWFKGSLDDLREVRIATQGLQEGKASSRPAILRKDFIVDEYQTLEARAYGADTVLLIVAILEVDRLVNLIATSRALGMEPLVEVHTDEEMRIALQAGARMIGINNRNLHTFDLDLGTTERVARIALELGVSWQPTASEDGKERIVLSALSGITSSDDVKRFSDMGVSMVLVGETLMRATDPAAEIRQLLGREESRTDAAKGLIKVCGIMSKEDALLAAAAGANIIGIVFAEDSPRRVTVERALEISKAVQAFGERSGHKLMGPPLEADNNADWFQGWAKRLSQRSQRTPLVAGVFQNQPSEEVRRVAEEAELDLVQLHGDEGLEACAECGVPALRVVNIPAPGSEEPGAEVSAEQRARSVVAALKPGFAAGVLLDTTVGGAKGGTGVTFDYKVAKLVGEAGVPVIVAGGLTPDNVVKCIAETESFGVDVSSGVETSKKGQKDIDSVRKFVREARRVQHALRSAHAE